MTQEVFDQAMGLLASTWPERGPTTETLAAYQLALGHLHDSTFTAAVADCLRTCTFYPKPAELLERAEALLTDAGLLPKRADAAWAEVLDAVHGPAHMTATGWEYEHTWTSPAIAEAMDLVGGLACIGQTQADDLPFLRKRFVEAYEQTRQRAVKYEPAAMAQALPAGQRQLEGAQA